MAIQQTYIMLKPDAVERRLMGEIITRIEKKGYRILQAKMIEYGALKSPLVRKNRPVKAENKSSECGTRLIIKIELNEEL